MPIHPTPPPGQHQEGTALPQGDAVRVPDAPGRAAPLLDLDVLRDMERDFPDTFVVERFARDFSETLEGKIDRLEAWLQDGDPMAAQDAVLSVTTSAAMVGATRLKQAALATQRFLAADDLGAAQRSVALLRGCATDTVRELLDTYLGRH
ncbi:Hpt domain-containing protein [Arthrobacter sp. MDT1-48-3]